PARGDVRPAHRGAAEVGQPAHHRRGDRGRPGGGRGGCADQRGAAQAAGRDRRQQLSRHRAVEGSESRRGGPRGAGSTRAAAAGGGSERGRRARAGGRRLAKSGRRPKLDAMTTTSGSPLALSPLALAQSRLLAPAGLDPTGLERTFGALLGPGIDFGDLYFQHARRESWTVEDGIVREGAHSIEQGVGVRAISGEKTGFAYSDDIN